MMQQYFAVKDEYPDCLLMFRLGDFYELFFDDAKLVARELELALTGRACGLEERAPMCGVPHHSATPYIKTLASRGYKIAICEQVEDPKATKGIVKREVVRVITPGTVDTITEIDGNDNLFIASVSSDDNRFGIAYGDITTGELIATEIQISETDELISTLALINPREIVLSKNIYDSFSTILNTAIPHAYINLIDESFYKLTTCTEVLTNHFAVKSLIPLGIDGVNSLISAAGSLLLYLIDTQKQDPANIKYLELRNNRNHMALDNATVRNLELLEVLYDKTEKGSLFGVLNKTKTAMGARLLKRFIKEPLNNEKLINDRLNTVEVLLKENSTRKEIYSELRKVYDFQRLTSKVACGRVNAKDLLALKQSLGTLPEIKELLGIFNTGLINDIKEDISDFYELYDSIDRAISEDAPLLITEGNIIKSGYSDELDSLRDSISDAKAWIDSLETIEKERTGIKTLKVGFNKVFGYYIDVSKSQIDKVPGEYIRKQTLVNNERYITPELKEKENLVLSAETTIRECEYRLFQELRESILPYIEKLQRASRAIALVDVLSSLAEVASLNHYVRPIVDDSKIIDIKDGRHPSVELMIDDGMFVPNDTFLSLDEPAVDNTSMLIITGPNMSGKSTYMRQTAMIVLMAQMGSFVPADHARIGAIDKVFTRIGASDNLSRGQSTFFVEMSELAYILRNATDRSLIILDEVGRGTSTFDGLSIAWATAEHLSKENHCIRTMLATHYHELTVLENEYSGVKNLSVAVADNGKDVVFLHKIVDRPANKSYGIHVAKIAGVPRRIRISAEKKLRELEANEHLNDKSASTKQLSFFDELNSNNNDFEYMSIVEEIRNIDINNMTPLEAMNKLEELKKELE